MESLLKTHEMILENTWKVSKLLWNILRTLVHKNWEIWNNRTQTTPSMLKPNKFGRSRSPHQPCLFGVQQKISHLFWFGFSVLLAKPERIYKFNDQGAPDGRSQGEKMGIPVVVAFGSISWWISSDLEVPTGSHTWCFSHKYTVWQVSSKRYPPTSIATGNLPFSRGSISYRWANAPLLCWSSSVGRYEYHPWFRWVGSFTPRNASRLGRLLQTPNRCEIIGNPYGIWPTNYETNHKSLIIITTTTITTTTTTTIIIIIHSQIHLENLKV